MSWFLKWLAAWSVVISLLLPSSVAAQTDCVFKHGFKALRDMIPETVGTCLENERFNAQNDSTEQRTTGGLLVWSKQDNRTAFTNGSLTWINGPDGLVSRPNTGPVFPWEAAGVINRPPVETGDYVTQNPILGQSGGINPWIVYLIILVIVNVIARRCGLPLSGILIANIGVSLVFVAFAPPFRQQLIGIDPWLLRLLFIIVVTLIVINLILYKFGANNTLSLACNLIIVFVALYYTGYESFAFLFAQIVGGTALLIGAIFIAGLFLMGYMLSVIGSVWNDD